MGKSEKCSEKCAKPFYPFVVGAAVQADGCYVCTTLPLIRLV